MKPTEKPIYIGTAGWSVPKAQSDLFPGTGTHLERYARKLKAVEINSSFYRDHQEATYDRWSDSTPADFRFSVKLPRKFSHVAKLAMPVSELKPFFESIRGLGPKLGVLLVQLPPRLAYTPELHKFFESLRAEFPHPIACEPRHPSWGEAAARPLFTDLKITKVMADPEPCPSEDDSIHSAGGFTYHRLHGSPEIYRSPYGEPFLSNLLPKLEPGTSWCIFDNTTFGHATRNALELHARAVDGRDSVDGDGNGKKEAAA